MSDITIFVWRANGSGEARLTVSLQEYLRVIPISERLDLIHALMREPAYRAGVLRELRGTLTEPQQGVTVKP